MIDVLFFARLREELGTQSVKLEFAGTVEALKSRLISENGERWKALEAENILCAVNQALAKPAHCINDGDEVAFYPPVTGG